MKLRILLLSHRFSPDIGGIETVSEILAENFSKAGHEIRVLTWSKEHARKCFSFEIIRNPGLKTLFSMHAWADLVFENNPCLRLAWPSVFFKKPSVVCLHTWLKCSKKETIQSYAKAIWLKRANKVISCSDVIRRKCWETSVVISNPYQEKIFKIIDNQPKREFIFLGRLVSDKGADIAISALAMLLNDETKNSTSCNKSIKMTIVGDGPEMAALTKMVSALNLKDNVEFSGALKGDILAEVLNGHSFLLVPSRWEEPFGLVALEGMACGCLPIVSDKGGLPDAVGRAGIIVDGSVKSFVDAMRRVINQPDLVKDCRKAAAGHLENHSSKVVARKYLSVVEELFTAGIAQSSELFGSGIINNQEI